MLTFSHLLTIILSSFQLFKAEISTLYDEKLIQAFFREAFNKFPSLQLFLSFFCVINNSNLFMNHKETCLY